jgi:hypothetical protein
MLVGLKKKREKETVMKADLLIPCSMILLEKLTAPLQTKDFTAFY